MSDFIKRLHEERLRTWEQAKALLDTAANEKRDLSAEEEATYGAMNARMDEIDARVTEVRDAHERAKASDEAFAALLAKPAAKPEQAERATDESAALRSFLRGEGKRSYDVRPNGPVDFRTLSKLSAGAGLNTVKTSFYDRLIAHLIEVSGVLATGPTVLSTATGESIQVPKTTAHSASASIVAEAGTIAANDPTFGQVTLDAFKYAFLLQVSHELLNDTSVDLMGYLAMQAGRALGNGFGVARSSPAYGIAQAERHRADRDHVGRHRRHWRCRCVHRRQPD
jgi:HK97 family phage major capsid protein